MQERIRNQFIRDEEARAQRHDAEELARSLLAEMAPAQRVRFMAGQMCEAAAQVCCRRCWTRAT